MTIVTVLGLVLNDDGSMKKELIKRIELGLKTFNEVKADYLVLTGGIANEKAGIAEARAMEKYVLEKGFDKDKIIVEEESKTTVENAFYVAKKFEGKKVDTMYVVSTMYHFYRPFLPKAHEVFIKEFPNTNIIKKYR